MIGLSNFSDDINTGFIGASSTHLVQRCVLLSFVNEIQVRKSGNAEIRVTSETGIAAVSVGRDRCFKHKQCSNQIWWRISYP